MDERESAWCLLTEFTQSESLKKHALAVEACMRAYAGKAGADVELWGMVGLLHDFDYEKYPSLDDHPYKGSEILKERGYSEEVRAIFNRARRLADQAEVGFMHERCAMQRVTWSLRCKVVTSKFAEFVIYQRQERFQSRVVTLLPADQKLGYCLGCG